MCNHKNAPREKSRSNARNNNECIFSVLVAVLFMVNVLVLFVRSFISFHFVSFIFWSRSIFAPTTRISIPFSSAILFFAAFLCWFYFTFLCWSTVPCIRWAPQYMYSLYLWFENETSGAFCWCFLFFLSCFILDAYLWPDLCECMKISNELQKWTRNMQIDILWFDNWMTVSLLHSDLCSLHAASSRMISIRNSRLKGNVSPFEPIFVLPLMAHCRTDEFFSRFFFLFIDSSFSFVFFLCFYAYGCL